MLPGSRTPRAKPIRNGRGQEMQSWDLESALKALSVGTPRRGAAGSDSNIRERDALRAPGGNATGMTPDSGVRWQLVGCRPRASS